MTVTGVLRDKRNHNRPISHQKLVVMRQVAGRQIAKRIATIYTNASGKYRYRVRAGAGGNVYVVYPGTHALRPASTHIKESFTGAVKIHASRVKAGGNLRLTGIVKGGYIPAGGVDVTVRFGQIGAPGTGTLGTIRTNNRGQFRFNQKFSRQTTHLRYKLWVVVTPQRNWPYMGATSTKLTRAVG